MPSSEIKKYQVYIYAGVRPNQSRMTVLLFNAKGNSSGILFFVDDDVALPPNETGGVPHGFYHASRYAEVIDLLRNESPVFIETSGKTDVSITTRMEPIGDGDKVLTRLFPLG